MCIRDSIFEDDGKTAYFYAYDRANPGSPILDAMHIYNANRVVDPDRQSEAEIRWSSDGLKAGLFINEYLHAVIDFENRKAYCRSEFPQAAGPWQAPKREQWNDSLVALFE